MRKIITIVFVGILVLSGLGAVAITEADEKQMKEESVLLSAPIFKEVDNYLTLDLKEATSLLMDTGKPMLPVVTKVYTFPLGTRINDVVVTFSGITEQILSKKIMPAPEPVPLLSSEMEIKTLSETSLDEKVYSSIELYPKEKYIVGTGVGLKDNDHVIYLTVRCNPVQYSPVENTIYAANSIDIDVMYQPPENPVIFPDIYDMVIITSEKFEAQLDPLVEHKNTMGIDTTVKTVEEIYSEYPAGRDDPEKIKLFIKYALEEWGIDYVMLFGGRKGQSLNWYIPERRSNNNDGSGYETGYASDLYYADIYKTEGNETVFEDWDSNENDIFAEWNGFNKDVIDFYPDVYVGRIPCRYSSQADTVINKIITYETTADDSWFKKAFVISGDTFPPARGFPPGYYEGEMETSEATDLLDSIGFDVEKLWTSLETFTGPNDVINAVNSGSGFIYFAGHGNPAYWGNFLPNAQTEDEMVDGLLLKHMRKLKNGEELPVVIVGGCHNAQFNVTMMNLVVGILTQGLREYFRTEEPYGDFWKKEWIPACWASWLLMKKGGGSIATIGNTGLGYGYGGAQCLEGREGWLSIRFFDAYVNQSKDILGETHSQAITDYITIIDSVNTDHIDRKTIEQWALIGDPSLKIGGYQ